MNSHLILEASRFAIKAHADTNHLYDKQYPYSVHLAHVVDAAYRFAGIVGISGKDLELAIAACWCHDCIEDARVTFNDLKKATNWEVANIVKAVTSYTRGINRAERMPDFIYEDIRTTPLATFVKLCDRIANIEYSSFTGSSMATVYRQELPNFKEKLYDVRYDLMFKHMDKMVNRTVQRIDDYEH